MVVIRRWYDGDDGGAGDGDGGDVTNEGCKVDLAMSNNKIESSPTRESMNDETGKDEQRTAAICVVP